MIPKRLHHIWLGDANPTEFENWLRDDFVSRHADWEIFYWRNGELLEHPDTAPWRNQLIERWRAVEKVCEHPVRRWAYRADILRLVVLFIHGGIYVDHDMFNVRRLDPLLKESHLFSEFRDGQVGEGLIGFPEQSYKCGKAIDWYLQFPTSKLMGLRLGPFARHNGWKTHPPEYFIPHPRLNPGDLYRCTENTYTIHCWRDHQYDREILTTLRAAHEIADAQ